MWYMAIIALSCAWVSSAQQAPYLVAVHIHAWEYDCMSVMIVHVVCALITYDSHVQGSTIIYCLHHQLTLMTIVIWSSLHSRMSVTFSLQTHME